MRSSLLTWRFAVVILTLGIAVAGLTSQGQQPTATMHNSQRILIHMKEYVAAIHETYMGLDLADRLQRSGAHVTVWLELQAVRLADERVVREGMDPKPGARMFSEIYKSFVEHGGRVLVCHHCAQFDDIGKERLRPGARFVDVGDIAQEVLAADKILDY